MISTLISDMGKVILHFDNHIFFKKMASFCSFSAEKIAEMSRSHFDLVESFDTGKIGPEEFYSQIVGRLIARIDFNHFFAIYNDVFSLHLPVLETMKKLKGKYRLVLLSNTDIQRFSFIKKKFPQILIFDDYVLSYEVGFMKPDPRIYQEALGRSNSEATECVFIDDIEENIRAAEALGIKTIHFEPGTDLERALREKGLSF